MADFLKLSFALQTALASGYLAYLIAYAGIRQHHTTTDTIFKSFAFGLIATTILTFGYDAPVLRTLVAIACTVAGGILWRVIGMNLWPALLRDADVSWADDIPTAWLSLIATKTDARVSELTVELTDGRLLSCEDTRDFANSPFGPCIFGLSGDVALYVTSEMKPNGDWFDTEDVSHPSQGDKITYVPASSIKRVELRHWTKRLNEKALREAAIEVVAAAPEGEPAA